MAFDIAVPADRATIGRTTVGGWPFLGPGNYLTVIPEYTQALIEKLVNADADVAAAINAAARAEAAAAALEAAGTYSYAALSGVVAVPTTEAQVGNLTFTLNPTTPATYLVHAHLDCAWSGSGRGTLVARLFVNNVPMESELVATASPLVRLPVHGVYVVGVPAGTHTFSLKARRLESAGIEAFDKHSNLLIERIK